MFFPLPVLSFLLRVLQGDVFWFLLCWLAQGMSFCCFVAFTWSHLQVNSSVVNSSLDVKVPEMLIACHHAGKAQFVSECFT